LLFRDDDHIDMFLAKFYATNNTQW
jgi:hypothetical protein